MTDLTPLRHDFGNTDQCAYCGAGDMSPASRRVECPVRLRAALDAAHRERDAAHEAGRLAERADVVTWLRGSWAAYCDDTETRASHAIADSIRDIERAEHVTPARGGGE